MLKCKKCGGQLEYWELKCGDMIELNVYFNAKGQCTDCGTIYNWVETYKFVSITNMEEAIR